MKSKFIFSELKIQNFRNIVNRNLTFEKGYNEIFGDNGVGKTSMLSAITWCLFGKDIDDRKIFAFKPLFNGVPQVDLNTLVELKINDLFVKREHKKGVTKISIGILDHLTNSISYSVKTQRNFEKELDTHFVEEQEFKALSNINYIPKLHWVELKKLIFSLIGEIKNEEILSTDDFSLISAQMQISTPEQIKSDLIKDMSSNKENVKKYEIELNTLNATKEKYLIDENDLSVYKNRKVELNKEIIGHNLKQEENQKLKQAIEENRFETKEKERGIVLSNIEIDNRKNIILEYNDIYSVNSFDVQKLRSQEISKLEIKKDNLENIRDNIINKIAKGKERKSDVQEKGKLLQKREVKIENSSCYACAQILPKEKLEELKAKAEQEHTNNLTNIHNSYTEIKAKIADDEKDLEYHNNMVSEVDSQIAATEIKVYDEVTETPIQKQYKTKIADLYNEIKEHELKIVKLGKELEELQDAKLNFKEVKEISISNLQKELEELNVILSTSVALDKIKNDIVAKETDLNSAKDAAIKLFEKQQQITKFNNVKANLLKQRVRKYFKLVEFITTEETKDGKELETFQISLNSIPYNELNSAGKIIIAIDLINGIQKVKGLSIPIIIDNVESITELPAVDSQLIVTRVTKQKIKTLELKAQVTEEKVIPDYQKETLNKEKGKSQLGLNFDD